MKDLLPIIRHAFPEAHHYDTLATIIQDNAEGYRIVIQDHHQAADDEDHASSVTSEEEEEGAAAPCPSTTTGSCRSKRRRRSIFLKTVDAEKYASRKAWADFRRTLMYLRTEVRFYNEFVPELERRGFRGDGTPRIYYAGYDVEGLMGEDEDSTDQTVPEPHEWSARGKGGSIIMDYIGDPYYFQDSPITMDQARETLSAVASLHASAWEDVELLQKAEVRLSRGSYHLKTRNVQELAGMEEAWEHFSSHFGEHMDPELFHRSHDMGRRIHDIAEFVSQEVSPSPTSSYATLSHGDFKSMNCFLSRGSCGSSGGNNVIMVDFASTGVGLGMSDVAMHIHHAIVREDLANGGEERLLEHYLDTLHAHLGPSRFYPKDVSMRHYRFAVVDYFRFFLGRFWKSATIESFTQKKESKNTALMNRNVASALAFLDRADRYLRTIEAERDAALPSNTRMNPHLTD